MRRFLVRAGLIVAAWCPFGAAGAQQLVQANGIVFDSLRSVPLSGALVAIVGSSRSTMTDAKGRFHFDSLASGAYTFTAQHDALDSAGFSGVSAKVRLDANTPEIRLALPSFSTLWRVACGERKESRDSGFVFGTIVTAAGAPVPAARVQVSWMDLTADKKLNVRQRRYHVETQSDQRGGYGVCGVPRDADIVVQAGGDTLSSGPVSVGARDIRVRRLDLVVAAQGASAARGIVVGRVVGPTSLPLAGARVSMEPLPEARTDTAGRFLLRDVPPGTQQLEVLAIGMAPALETVNVRAGDTTFVDVKIARTVQLEAVKVTATKLERVAKEIAARKKIGLGYFQDSTQLGRSGTIASALNGVPSVHVVNANRTGAATYVVRFSDSRGGECTGTLFLDGVKSYPEAINFLRPEDLALVEMYPHKADVPMEFQVGNPQCGVAVIWTKQGLR